MRVFQYTFLLACVATTACSNVTEPVIAQLIPSSASMSVLVNETTTHETSMTNGCNGEQVIGTGQDHVLATTVDTPSGNTIARVSFSETFNGVGVTTGTSYEGRTNVVTDFKLGNGSQVVASDVAVKVVSKGAAPNFTAIVRTHVTLNANGTVTANTETIRTICK